MALIEMMSFVNSGVLMVSFALLLIVLSVSVSQINSVAVYANAKSVAGVLGTRIITSPNCFAYKSTTQYFNSGNSIVGGPIFSVSNTEPGVLDVGKFSEDNFLSCLQYTYFGGATAVPVLPNQIGAFAGASMVLTDTQDPTDLGNSGSLYYSNFPQLTFGSKFTAIERTVAQQAQIAEYTSMAVSIALSITISTLTAGILNANLILATGSNSINSIAPRYSLASAFFFESHYTESFPVLLQFTNYNDQPTHQDAGVLQVTIYYDPFVYGAQI
jgi:hypothetical protein